MSTAGVCGLVLAAGAGTRFGGPKALARAADGTPWTLTAVQMLRSAGCARVVVALGADAERAEALVPAGAHIVRVADWADGLSATLRAGMAAAADAAAILITPVDTPDAPPSAALRLLDAAPQLEAALVQAVYGGRPGHPVLIGRTHVAGLSASLRGDRGARAYLVAHGAREVECGDLWSGADIDR